MMPESQRKKMTYEQVQELIVEQMETIEEQNAQSEGDPKKTMSHRPCLKWRDSLSSLRKTFIKSHHSQK